MINSWRYERARRSAVRARVRRKFAEAERYRAQLRALLARRRVVLPGRVAQAFTASDFGAIQALPQVGEPVFEGENIAPEPDQEAYCRLASSVLWGLLENHEKLELYNLCHRELDAQGIRRIDERLSQMALHHDRYPEAWDSLAEGPGAGPGAARQEQARFLAHPRRRPACSGTRLEDEGGRMNSATLDYLCIKALAKQLRRPASTLYALSAGNDPFYITPARQEAAKWFASEWWRLNIRTGWRYRRIHYVFVSQGGDDGRLAPGGL